MDNQFNYPGGANQINEQFERPPPVKISPQTERIMYAMAFALFVWGFGWFYISK